MKFAYITSHPIIQNDGVSKKILEQIETCAKFGVETKLFVNANFRKFKLGTDFANRNFVKYYDAKNKLSRIFNKALIEDVKAFNPDLVYYRYDFYTLNYEILSNKYKTVIEIQTKDIDEFFLTHIRNKKYGLYGYFSYLYFFLGRNRFLNKASAFVGVTNEILDYYSSFCKPAICIPNGINLSKYNTIKKAYIDEKVRFFFIGTEGMPWHGIDIIESLAQKLPQYEFHIVGINKKSELNNLKYYGPMNYEVYIKILEKCHICIGTLALYRNNMKEACTLKVREYLAHGFPVILGYKDTAFLNNTPDFILELEFCNDEVTNDHIQKIKEFTESQKNRIVKKEELSAIDIYSLEEKKIKFLKNLLK